MNPREDCCPDYDSDHGPQKRPASARQITAAQRSIEGQISGSLGPYGCRCRTIKDKIGSGCDLCQPEPSGTNKTTDTTPDTTPDTPMGRIMGRWPGDETDAEIERGLASLQGKPDNTTDPLIGWRIVAIGDDGSVLLSSSTGERRRYWFRGKLETAIIDAATKVVRLASEGDQNFIACLDNDFEAAELRYALVELGEALRDI